MQTFGVIPITHTRLKYQIRQFTQAFYTTDKLKNRIASSPHTSHISEQYMSSVLGGSQLVGGSYCVYSPPDPKDDWTQAQAPQTVNNQHSNKS